jgi:hypothetical protein
VDLAFCGCFLVLFTFFESQHGGTKSGQPSSKKNPAKYLVTLVTLLELDSKKKNAAAYLTKGNRIFGTSLGVRSFT